MWFDGNSHSYLVAWLNFAARHNDAHDARLADEPAIRCAMHKSRHEARLKLIELFAGIAQACETKDHMLTYEQFCSFWQGKQINPLGRDVLAQLTRLDSETLLPQFREQLTVDEVHLAQVGLSWVFCYA